MDSTGGRDAGLRALRTRLRETTDQLDRAQIDADTSRERLALTQRALEEEIQHGGAHEVSIRQGGRTGSWTTRSTLADALEATGIGDPDEDAVTV